MELNVIIFTSNIQKLNKLKSIFEVVEYSINVSAFSSFLPGEGDALKNCDILIIDDSFPALSIILDNLEKVNSGSAVLLLGELSSDSENKYSKMYHIDKESSLIPMLSILNKMINTHFSDRVKKKSLIGYIPIKVTQLLRLTKAPADLFLKLSEQKFVKCINADDESMLDIIKRYQDKDFQFFYITKDDYYQKCDKLFDGLLPKEEDYLNSGQTKEMYFSNSQSVIYELMSDLGVGENVIQLSEELVQDVCREYKNTDLSILFDKFKYSKERYIFDHSTMTSMFAIAICTSFEWRNTEIYKKLAMAAIYHDFGFANPKLALIEQDSEEIKKLSKSFKREVLDHPEIMAQKLSSFKGVSGETISMVLKHHEAHGEEGYPKKLSSAHLSVLECIFIAAHEFTNQIYRIAFRQDKMHLAIQRTLEFLDSDNFKPVREPFLKMIKNNYLKQAP